MQKLRCCHYQAACHLIQPRWQKSVCLVTYQNRSRNTAQAIVSTVQGSSPRTFPRSVIPHAARRKPARVVMRYFSKAQVARRKGSAKGKPAPPSSQARHCCAGCDDATAREGAVPVLMLVSSISINLAGSKGGIARRRHSRASFESRVGVRRFRLRACWDRCF